MSTGQMPEFDFDLSVIKNLFAGRLKLIISVVSLIALLLLLSYLKGVLADWFWFDGVGYSGVFITVLIAQLLLFVLGFLITLGVLLLALFASYNASNGPVILDIEKELEDFARKAIKYGSVIGAIVVSAVSGSILSNQWELILKFLNSQSFNVTDPMYSNDISLYVFQLPAISFIQNWIIGILVASLILSVVVSFANFSLRGINFTLIPRLKMQFLVTLALIVLLFALGQLISRLMLVNSGDGLIFGATYTDVHSKNPALIITFVVGLIASVVMIVGGLLGRLRLALIPLGIWIILTLALTSAWPSMMQQFSVSPNEFVKEKKYLERNIEFTRKGFGLDSITETYFEAKSEITGQLIEDNMATVKNIRLWDPRPLTDVYRQIQLIRPYYDFSDADVDRYTINGEYRQVLLSAREVAPEKLAEESQTWVNEKLFYTHGIGVAMSPATEFTDEGRPVFFAKDIPSNGEIPVSDFTQDSQTDILISNPRIYYGENTRDYVIVNTNTQELDYQTSEGDLIKTNYFGDGGVILDSLLKKILYAWEMGDVNILISSELKNDSRIQYRRQIQERVEILAPFLKLDGDPYMVATNNQIYWIQDAYTSSDKYPYSNLTNNEWGKFNYLRNSVKIVVDAFSGDVKFYLWDTSDPVALTYQQIFPNLFVDSSTLPADLQDHIRYPQDLFAIQAEKYIKYHMQNPEYFYGNEDLWAFPNEKFGQGDELQIVEPYYAIMKLPGETEEEFVQLIPYTPNDRPNLVGWLAARSDQENYGNIVAVNFPKDTQIDGPEQVEARIDNDQEISAWFTLRCSEGSSCIRGNLFVVPIGTSLLYAEPIYIQAEGVSLPELKKVILASADQVVMGDSLDEAIFMLTGSKSSLSNVTQTPDSSPTQNLSEKDNPIDEILKSVESLQKQFEELQQLIQSLK